MERILKLLTAMLIASTMTLVSCSDDTDDNGGKIVPNTGKTSVRFILKQSAPHTYAPANASTPTTEERTIKTASLYIFNSVKTLEQVVPMTVNSGAASEIFETTTGTHYVYALVNPPVSKIPTFSVGSTTLLEFEKSIIQLANIEELTNAATTGFFMTNITRPNAEVFNTGGTEDNPATTISIQVGRAVAKVNVEFKADPAQQPLGLLSSVQYTVRNNPKEMYLMPFYNGNVLETPFFNAAHDENNYFDNPSYINADGSTATYTTENSNAGKVLKGKATYVLIKGVFTPTTTYNTQGVEDASVPSVGSDFYRIYEPATNTYTVKIYSEAPSTTEVGAATNDVNAQIIQYPGGVSYYPLFLADNTEIDEVAKYTVKRNSYFYLTIKSVNGPGISSSQDPIKPNEPIVTDTWLEASIDILDWVVIDQQGGI